MLRSIVFPKSKLANKILFLKKDSNAFYCKEAYFHNIAKPTSMEKCKFEFLKKKLFCNFPFICDIVVLSEAMVVLQYMVVLQSHILQYDVLLPHKC